MGTNSIIEKDIEELHSHLNRMIELYNEDHIDEAGSKVKNIFAKITNALLREAGLPTDQKAIEKLDALYQNKWLTDEENNHLHKLRKIRNLFVHDDDTEMGDDSEKQQMLEDYTNNFQKCINYCQKDIEWFEEKIYDVSEGIKVDNSWNSPPQYGEEKYDRKHRWQPPFSGDYYHQNQYENDDSGLLKRTSSIVAVILAAVSLAFSLGWIFFFRTSNLEILDKKTDLSAFGKGGTAVFIAVAVLFLLNGLFFYPLLPQFFMTVLTSSLAYSVTDSNMCTVLVAVLTVLLTSRFTLKIRYILFWLISAFCFLIGTFIAIDYCKHYLVNGEPLDGHTRFVKIFLPIAAYYFVFFAGHFTLGTKFIAVMITAIQEFYRIPLNTLAVIGMSALVGYLYRDTWKNGMIIFTRDFFDSKPLFFAVHILLALLIIYFICAAGEDKYIDTKDHK